MPESFLLGDRAVYIDAFLAAKSALSPDGMIPERAPTRRFARWPASTPRSPKAKLDLGAVFTNEFVKKANAKYPKG